MKHIWKLELPSNLVQGSKTKHPTLLQLSDSREWT